LFFFINFLDLKKAFSLASLKLKKITLDNMFMICLNECFLFQNVIHNTFQNNINEITNVIDLVLTETSGRINM
jgi:hypothetical protein